MEQKMTNNKAARPYFIIGGCDLQQSEVSKTDNAQVVRTDATVYQIIFNYLNELIAHHDKGEYCKCCSLLYARHLVERLRDNGFEIKKVSL